MGVRRRRAASEHKSWVTGDVCCEGRRMEKYEHLYLFKRDIAFELAPIETFVELYNTLEEPRRAKVAFKLALK